jgi:SAM-dependent methyltransferase
MINLLNPLMNLVRRLARAVGLLPPPGGGYLNPRELLKGAAAAGVDVNVHIESTLGWTGFCRRADDFFSHLQRAGAFNEDCRHVLEIGAGSGQHIYALKKIRPRISCTVYEPHPIWRRHLRQAYGATTAETRGESLKETADGSVDLLHAHAVFVYLPCLTTAAYFKEAARVIRKGGHLSFDAYTEDSFTAEVTDKWLAGDQRYPVLLPREFILQNLAACGFTFIEETGALKAESRYFIFRKD